MLLSGVVAEFRAALARGGDRPPRLIAPTASLAEHLRHQIARTGLAVPTASVQTLAELVESLTPGCRTSPPALEALLLGRVLERVAPPEFASVAGYPGFRAALLRTIREFWTAGAAGRARELLRAPRERSFARVMLELETELNRLGRVHRARRLRLAAEQARQLHFGAVFFDGFLDLSEPEVELARALAAAADKMAITLPESGAEPARRALAESGVPETRTESRPGLVHPQPVVWRAPTPEREVEEIAARILDDRTRSGRRFSDYGIVLRTPELYEPIVAVVLERFGIPYRWRPPAIHLHPVIQSLRELVRTANPGWTAERQPPEEWAQRFADLARAAGPPPDVSDPAPRETVLEWRGWAGAVKVWQEAASLAAEAMSGSEAELTSFLAAVETALPLIPPAARDLRRQVVQVLNVYEARQWRLPVVFLCGLVEKQFPRHHAQNLFFPDARRRELIIQGLPLRLTEDLDREERFLFDWTLARAAEEVHLSYPAQDEDGRENVRSFFLEPYQEQEIPSRRVAVRETTPDWRPAPAFLRAPELGQAAAEQHRRLSPSSLEDYLQCPFLFFAHRTLRLQGPSLPPERRLDAALGGVIAHRAIARWMDRGGGAIGPLLEEVFSEVCAREGIEMNFRSEAIQLELRSNLERFAAVDRARTAAPGFELAPTEQEFEFPIEAAGRPPFRIAGRIDRYEVSAAGAAVVVDYKYSGKAIIRKLVEDHEKGNRLQAALYLLALERQRGLRPAGAVFYGLRGEPSRGGWYVEGLAPAEPALRPRGEEEFRAWREAALQRALAVLAEVGQGRVEVQPRDRQYCRRACDYREVCRISL